MTAVPKMPAPKSLTLVRVAALAAACVFPAHSATPPQQPQQPQVQRPQVPQPQPQWVSYGESETGSYFFDPGSVRTEGERKRVWRLFALKQARDGVQSGKALIEFQCKEGTYRYLRTLYYSGPMGQGQYVGGAKAQGPEPFAPGTMIGELAQKVC